MKSSNDERGRTRSRSIFLPASDFFPCRWLGSSNVWSRSKSNPAAARDLEANRPGGGGAPVEVRTADVEQFLEKYKEKPELVVLDPPRAGLTPRRSSISRDSRPTRITYVSCEPPTLARDLAALQQAGYEIAEHAPVRSFPADISHGDGRAASPAPMKLPALWIAAAFAAGIALGDALAGEAAS